MSVVSPKARLLWAAFLVLSLIAAIAAVKLYFVVAPGLSVEITFSRSQAIAAAQAFQKEHFPELQTSRTAMTFVTDQHLQNYVELEAGGVPAFQKLIPELDAVTHYWKLRNFAEGQEEELILAFSPQGDFISFAFIIPAQKPGAALGEEEARALAEAGARLHLGERFNAYKPLETKVMRQTTGRADHSFTYEHDSLQAGEARFRLNLQVAGDQLVAVDTFKHIPQAFNQRFGEMRALNNQISQVSNFFLMGLFGLCGLVGGGIWLYRRHQLHWRAALLPAAVVAAGMGAMVLANLPSAWMNYRTTDTAASFLLQQAYQVAMFAVGFGLVLSIVYAVAEGLSRMAFAGQLRLYDAWRRPVAASPEMLGRVLGGYAWTGLFLAYAVLFILLSTQFLGWWSPAGMRTDPNILSSWRPALVPIFAAVQAGTWEECLFRAIPLALAVIIGRRFNMLKPVVIGTLVLQAIVFAGVHANYPQLPGYSRLIELFIPALAFGLVYLRYGLIPCMIAHFLYDLVLMSFPIFVADDPGLWVDRVLVIAAGAAPLAMVLYARWRQGAWLPLAEQWRNGIQLKPEEMSAGESHTPVPASISPQTPTSPLALRAHWLWAMVVAGIVIIIANWMNPPRIDWPAFEVNRAEATRLAEAELAQRGVVLEGEWRRTVTTNTNIGSANHFVWRESGRDVYQSLIGQHLDTPFWVVTWRRFDGPVEERSEQWSAWLYPDGGLHELVHYLPEGRPGASLSREQAIELAREWMLSMNWPDPLTLEEKAVEEIKRPGRIDWRIRYSDKSVYDHNNAQAIISITLSGDETTGYVRSIDVPQEWHRAEDAKNAGKTPFRIATGVSLFGLFVVAMCGFLGRHSGRRFRFNISLPWILINSLSLVIVSLLWIDPALQGLDNTMSWKTQLAMMVFMWLLGAVVIGVISFLIAQVIYAEQPGTGNARHNYLFGAALAFGFSGIITLQYLFLPSGTPAPYLADYATPVPWLTVIANGFKAAMPIMMSLLLSVGLLRFCKGSVYRTGWRTLLIAALVLVWLVSGTLASDEMAPSIVGQLLALAKAWLILELVRRRQMGAAIAFAFVVLALRQLGVAHALYPLAWLHSLIGFVAVAGVGYLLVAHWHKHADAKL